LEECVDRRPVGVEPGVHVHLGGHPPGSGGRLRGCEVAGTRGVRSCGGGIEAREPIGERGSDRVDRPLAL
jgi:hypothetical protein